MKNLDEGILFLGVNFKINQTNYSIIGKWIFQAWP